ncbi:hypothetical protein BDK51DRAFT_46564 [Blyttiomyces helicus]|uniref:Uncharacterized protein n=1 Tax=Blyttiomyces helicus TaxID=388810 RepID=A0A4V1IRL4_9FUNG|nr:hypothetical protein BDK51DRAFT_46564 [Blyttiomyces helicus]|eukprot:RKO90467.1 hypothetical protein BDK51DRAFT_46564 [Blyttiomyces helicus]
MDMKGGCMLVPNFQEVAPSLQPREGARGFTGGVTFDRALTSSSSDEEAQSLVDAILSVFAAIVGCYPVVWGLPGTETLPACGPKLALFNTPSLPLSSPQVSMTAFHNREDQHPRPPQDPYLHDNNPTSHFTRKDDPWFSPSASFSPLPAPPYLPSFSTLDHALDFPTELAPLAGNFESDEQTPGPAMARFTYSPVMPSLPNSPILQWSSSPGPSVPGSPLFESARFAGPTSAGWVPVPSREEDVLRVPSANYHKGAAVTPAPFTSPDLTYPSPLATLSPSPPRPTIPISSPKPAAKNPKSKTIVEKEVFCVTCAQPIATLLFHGPLEATEVPHRVEIDCIDCDLARGLGGATVAAAVWGGKKRKAEGEDSGGRWASVA